jgi:hypothetical protein
MRTLNRLFLLAVIGLTLQACGDANDGAAEQAGQALDQAAEQAGQAAEQAGQAAGQAADQIQQQTQPPQQ